MRNILNIGCGYLKLENAINIDIDERCNPDQVVDVTKGLPFPDNHFDFVYAHQVLEHIFDWEKLMLEIWRVMKLGAEFYAGVPMFPSRNAIAGGGHVRMFVPENFLLFTDPRFFQPRCHVCESQGLFEKVDMKARKVQTDDEEPGTWIASLEVILKKVDKAYWKEQDVTNGLTTDVRGCFWCKHELVWSSSHSKVCEHCGETYTFAPRKDQ
jgi:SAM-dependent methyltransferase